MPDRVADLIAEESSKNKLANVIPLLVNILRADRDVVQAYLCNADTTQIFKLRTEGNHFCGYRNIQMLLASSRTIPTLQKDIETAWDNGFNSHGRVETGGIIGTRKHIGTSEVREVHGSTVGSWD